MEIVQNLSIEIKSDKYSDNFSNSHLPNHDAWIGVKLIGSPSLVKADKVIAGKPRPIPDDNIEIFAVIEYKIWNLFIGWSQLITFD